MNDVTLNTILEHMDDASAIRLRVGTQLAIYGRVSKLPFTVRLNYAYTNRNISFDEKFGFLEQGPLHFLEKAILKPRNSVDSSLNYLDTQTAQEIIKRQFDLKNENVDFGYSLEYMIARIFAPDKTIMIGASKDESTVAKIETYKSGKKYEEHIPKQKFFGYLNAH